MAKAREIPGLEDSRTFREAAGRALAVRAEEVFAHSRGVLDTSDIERVHDMRVATRRLRAALEIFAPCFPKREHGPLLKEVKALADALGERRDRDVAIDALERVADDLTADDRPGIEDLVDYLRVEREAANVTLALALERAARADLRARLALMAELAAGAAVATADARRGATLRGAAVR